MRRRAIAAALLPVVLFSCLAPSASYLQDRLEKLSLPGSWELVQRQVEEGPTGCFDVANLNCPAVFEYYAIPSLHDAYAELEAVLLAAGYRIEDEFSPLCDGLPGASACAIVAVKDGVMIRANFERPGTNPYGIAVSWGDRALVRLIARDD